MAIAVRKRGGTKEVGTSVLMSSQPGNASRDFQGLAKGATVSGQCSRPCWDVD